jgi:hypothetical protein
VNCVKRGPRGGGGPWARASRDKIHPPITRPPRRAPAPGAGAGPPGRREPVAPGGAGRGRPGGAAGRRSHPPPPAARAAPPRAAAGAPRSAPRSRLRAPSSNWARGPGSWRGAAAARRRGGWPKRPGRARGMLAGRGRARGDAPPGAPGPRPAPRRDAGRARGRPAARWRRRRRTLRGGAPSSGARDLFWTEGRPENRPPFSLWGPRRHVLTPRPLPAWACSCLWRLHRSTRAQADGRSLRSGEKAPRVGTTQDRHVRAERQCTLYGGGRGVVCVWGGWRGEEGSGRGRDQPRAPRRRRTAAARLLPMWRPRAGGRRAPARGARAAAPGGRRRGAGRAHAGGPRGPGLAAPTGRGNQKGGARAAGAPRQRDAARRRRAADWAGSPLTAPAARTTGR